MRGETFRQGFQAAIPTALGYISISIACGIISASYIQPMEMILMSLFVYAGSSQFAILTLIGAQAPLTAIALTVFLINLRHFLLGLHTSTFFRTSSLWKNIGIGTFLTDETYGVLISEHIHTKDITPQWMYGNILTSYFAWLLGTILGVAFGSFLPNPESFGLDFALLGMFIGIFSSQFLVMLKKIALKKILTVLGAVAVSFFCLASVLSQSLAVLVATLIGCAVGVMVDEQ